MVNHSLITSDCMPYVRACELKGSVFWPRWEREEITIEYGEEWIGALSLERICFFSRP